MVNSAVKVFKKSSPNGKLVAYLSRRDFVDHLKYTAPIDGVIVVDDDYIKGRKVFASVVITFRHGREEDEVMGLNFSKEYELVNFEILPKAKDDSKLSGIQSRLIEKLGNSTRPFSITLPECCPSSVTLEPGENHTEKPLGVHYDLKFYVADTEEERVHKRNTVNLAVRKVQYAPSQHDGSRPYMVVSKNFTLGPGMLKLEVGLNQDLYFHGQAVDTCIKISNGSKKTVKTIQAQVVQHVDITMTNTVFSRTVASIESCEGCPITPGSKFERSIELHPKASNMLCFGVALDGKMRDKDVNLASSTIGPTGKSVEDALGIMVSYSVKVKLLCGAIGGELAAEVPFSLMHPDPDSDISKPDRGIDFEEFSVLRRGKSIDEFEED